MTDLISRQAALDEIDKNRLTLLSLGMDGAEHILAHYGRREIEELPTIDPVKHGAWLKYPGEVVSDDGLWGETLFDCSNCGHTVHVATRFCSKCGTKMDEPDKPKQISAEFAKLMREGEIQVRWKNEAD